MHLTARCDTAPRGLVVLGHGAGGGLGAPDLAAVTGAAVRGSWSVVLVEQPWLVSGRRIATAPARLDVAWAAVLPAAVALAGAEGLPLVVGGRSAGARVACRYAAVGTGLEPAGVLALAFPLVVPRSGADRSPELLGAVARVPTLVVQGERDEFGGPEQIRALTRARRLRVLTCAGGHDLRTGGRTSGADQVVVPAVRRWLIRRAASGAVPDGGTSAGADRL